MFVCLLFLTPLPCDILKEKKTFIMTHGMCKLMPLKLKMSLFFFRNNLFNCRVGEETSLTAVICLAKNKLLEQRLVNSGVRVFLAEV